MARETLLRDIVHLERPEFYGDERFAVYQRLRREAPVFLYEPLDAWVVTTYDLTRRVARNAQLFSSANGLTLADARSAVRNNASNTGELFGGDTGEIIAVTDPPRHRTLRRVAATPFTAGSLERFRSKIEQVCHRVLDQVQDGEPIDWTQTVASELPIHMATALLGLPDDREADIRRWSDAVETSANPATREEAAAAMESFASLGEFLYAQYESKRCSPDDDVLSWLVEVAGDNQDISVANVVALASALIAGGSDTTRSLLSGIVALLGRHPDQLDALVSDPSLIPQAVEETLRYVTPARGFLRTATTGTVLGGREVGAGQHVYFVLESANRDESVFDAPEEFDIIRPRSNQQLAFGFGPHVCVAAPLVRLETRILLEILLERFRGWRPVGAEVPIRSTFRNGWTSVPVVFESR